MKNVEWFFSGLGVAILIAIIQWIRDYWRDRKDRQNNATSYFKELHHVSLVVKDLAKAMAFYGDFLKLRPIKRPGRDIFDFDGVWYALPYGKQLHLVESQQGTFRNRVFFDEGAPPDIHFALRVNSPGDYTTIHGEAKRLNIPYLFEPFKGLQQLYLLDPDNNVIEVSNFTDKQVKIVYL